MHDDDDSNTKSKIIHQCKYSNCLQNVNWHCPQYVWQKQVVFVWHTHTHRNNKPIKKRRRRRITEKKNEQKTHQLMSREKEQQIVIVNISIIAWRLGVTRLQILNVGSWSNANVCRQELYKRTCFCCAFNLFFFADCFYYFLFACVQSIRCTMQLVHIKILYTF